MLTKPFYSIITTSFVVLLLSSCATTTTEGTGASSGSIENSSESFSDFTSSTSGDDDKDARAAKVMIFVKSNFNRVRSDMAVGAGEYLTTLAVLLSIDNAKKEHFYVFTKENFGHLFVSSETTAEELVAHLYREMAHAQL
ncbi:MAG: DUF3015 family protein [Methylococcales bacterium]